MRLFDCLESAFDTVEPTEYIIACRWNGVQIHFATVTEPGLAPVPEVVIVRAPDSQIGLFAVTEEQLEALRAKYEQDANGAESFEVFKEWARPAGVASDMYITVPWCGMSLAIERDGHTHT